MPSRAPRSRAPARAPLLLLLLLMVLVQLVVAPLRASVPRSRPLALAGQPPRHPLLTHTSRLAKEASSTRDPLGPNCPKGQLTPVDRLGHAMID